MNVRILNTGSRVPTNQRNFMNKPTVHIIDWSITDDILYGKVLDHPRFDKGTRIKTSEIESRPSTPQEGDTIETRNTIYVLGKRDLEKM